MPLKLTIATKAPFIDYPSLIAANLINSDDKAISINFINEKGIDDEESSIKIDLDGKIYYDQLQVLNVLATNFPKVLVYAAESQDWIQFAITKLYNKSYQEVIKNMQIVDEKLSAQSHLVSQAISLADIVVFGVLKSNPVALSILKKNACPNVSKWYQLIAEDEKIKSILQSLVKEINNSRITKKKEGHKANFEINLPEAKMGEVVTRFPPEPSGYLHIGHVKAAILNEYFAHAYKGKMIIRFDDTNPTKERVEFQDSIIEDLAFLGVKGDKITYSSDYFDTMYQLAIKMIESGKAYCDDTPLEKMRQERMVGNPSTRRERMVEENLKIFTEDMKNGTEEGLKHVLRAKIDYQDPNKALRDPVLYRTNLTPHHRTGDTWKMYPTYDFCAPVVDSIEGVTHSLRTNEYRDRNPQYEWILLALGLRYVHIWDFGRINFVRTLLSKRKLQWFVDKGYVSGWDDPRFPTIRGVQRRGMSVQGLRNFIMAQGPSRNIINLEWSVLWALNKKIIDPVAPRFTAINSDNAVEVKLSNVESGVKTETKPKHKKNSEIGNKTVVYSNKILIEQEDAASFAELEEVTFMDWGNVIIKSIHKLGDLVTAIEADLHLEGDFRKTSKKITWLGDTVDKVEVKLADFDHLITKDKLEDGDNFEDFITPQSEFLSSAYADVNIRKLKRGDVVQFERKGYFRLDVPLGTNQPVFFTIPDGKSKK